MTLYFAPLEGVTDAVFRRIHHECFPGVSKYFIPFISPTQNLAFTSRDLAAIAPENNIGVPAVPQLLAKDASLFLWAAQALCDMGYPEVNLNLGCPSGTVTAKGKGSGLLADVPALERLLVAFLKSRQSPSPLKRGSAMPAWKNGIACSTYLLAIPSMNSSSTRAHAPNFIGERLTRTPSPKPTERSACLYAITATCFPKRTALN